MISSANAISRAKPAAAPPARGGIAARFVLADGVATPGDRVAAPAASAAVDRGRAPFFADAGLPIDRLALERFAADVATAPEIVGELVALYVEQFPRLAIRFARRALGARPDAAQRIEAAARWREVCGLPDLAFLIRAALDFALPPTEEPPSPQPVVIDVDLDFLDLQP